MISIPVRIVDPSKDLNSYGLNSVDWKERVESWKVKQDKNMMQVTNKYLEARGEHMQMYKLVVESQGTFVAKCESKRITLWQQKIIAEALLVLYYSSTCSFSILPRVQA
ncbi:hypothetical protein ABZP36_035603 [Zizania latifolia]